MRQQRIKGTGKLCFMSDRMFTTCIRRQRYFCYTGGTRRIVHGVLLMMAAVTVQIARSASASEAPDGGVTLTITEGTGKTVKPIFSSSYSNLEKRYRVENSPELGAHIAALGLNIIGYTVGSDLQWYHVLDEKGTYGVGFNAWPRELQARGRTIDEAYGGALIPRKDQNGNPYPYWLDFMHTLILAGADFLMCPNIYSVKLAYDGTEASLEPFWKEFDRMVSDVAGAGQAIPVVQLGTESQLYRDLFPNGAKDYAALCDLVVPGIRKRLPQAILSVDGSNGRNPQWDDTVASIDGIDAMRLYLQILGKPHNDYPGMRRRVNADLPEMVDDFIRDYPDKKIVLLQMALKNRHPLHHRVAHGLYLAELYVRLAKLNLEHDDIIQVASQMNLRHLFGNTVDPAPPYYGMLAVRDIWGGIARDCRADGTGLVTFAVEKPDGHHVVVVNPADQPVTIGRVVVNGKSREDFVVDGYHGDLNSLTVSRFDSLQMPPHSWAAVTIPSIGNTQ